MFRDRDESLQRLQEQLLEEEEQETAEEEYLEDEDMDSLLEGNEQGQGPEVYLNDSNGYGRKLRNYATGYKAYNSDKTDEDLEDFSRRVMEPPAKTGGGRIAAVFILLTVAVLALLWLLARREGLL